MAEKEAAPPPKAPAPEPPPEKQSRFVRFDLPPGATPEEIVEGLRKLAEKHVKPKP